MSATDENGNCLKCRAQPDSCHTSGMLGYPGDQPCRICQRNHWPRCGNQLTETMLRNLMEDLVRKYCRRTGEPYAYVNADLNAAVGIAGVEYAPWAALWARYQLALSALAGPHPARLQRQVQWAFSVQWGPPS